METSQISTLQPPVTRPHSGPTATTNMSRGTRYSTRRNKPEDLGLVVRKLRRHQIARRSGFIPTTDDLRGTLASASKAYERRARADELIRFACNTGMLILDNTGRYWVNPSRCQEVLLALRNSTDLPVLSPQDLQASLHKLYQEHTTNT